MDKSQVVQFLEAVDAELAKYAGEGKRLDVHRIGRCALIVRYGLDLATKEVDRVTRTREPELEAQVFALFGKGTAHALRWGLYLEGVPPGVPPVPGPTTPCLVNRRERGRAAGLNRQAEPGWPGMVRANRCPAGTVLPASRSKAGDPLRENAHFGSAASHTFTVP